METSFNILRRYYLISEDGGAAGDVSYALIFTTTGEMVVRVTKHHAQQYKAPEIHDVSAREFLRVTIGGKSLQELIVRKLDEILPCGE